jgi:putative transposase
VKKSWALDLTRFRGHRSPWGEEGVHHAEVWGPAHRIGPDGSHPEKLGRQFEPSTQTIRNWLRQADRDDGRRSDGLTTEEREEIRRLRRASDGGGRLGGGEPACVRDEDAPDPTARPAPDLVQRTFTVDRPDHLWVADITYITYIPTWAGFLSLAVVLDAWSRRVIEWAMAAHLRTELVIDALNMAVGQRRPTQVIHHSDQGCQYTSVAFGLRCREIGIRPSVGSVGDAYDNALCEGFFATLECELLDRRRFATQVEARLAVSKYVEGWYNTHRRHSALDYESPTSCERSTSGWPKLKADHCPRNRIDEDVGRSARPERVSTDAPWR